MGGSIGHPPAAARRAEATALARIRDQPVLATGIAVHPEESIGEDAAVEERPQFPLHEPGHTSVPSALRFEEGLDVSGDNAVKDTLGGVSGTVDSRRLTNLKAWRNGREEPSLALKLLSRPRRWMCVGHCACPTCRPGQVLTPLTVRLRT